MGFIAFLIWLFLMVITFIKARDFGRSKLLWVIIGLVLSPILALIGLLILGKSDDN
ncbi:putative membrane protein [Erwinia phage pEa_SNUABM_50]|uniref:Uncharacterized protein n=4 Tax=Eneladusvirus BF TaxID=2560751 RepID=A0A1S6UA43_9CAUD|nr:hypothetical protein FDH34_gp080 [Serratia phage BF]QOI71018.1 putative membrane protein [Erwinia phage pEa_SNUABM_12]QOI71563.1 putative membrane protein [Erwinia phage pEa_SNUABM_47]QOI72102.1 putative membrane protein [Erwinia phage pEa_SNUABM_50]QXO11227.1 hypothetical protein pEaSNUABM19_00081 [Erwinia phage pEa_SNUABM_19]QXO11775.1 hypothetical protein pEaSNUABM44_00079 [Erwinia phage pEa_SNUABM_44]QXO12327.1 hypothetical protein pEaSNUABM49_00081 [Erwinia phage pEa_SNUABM_49]